MATEAGQSRLARWVTAGALMIAGAVLALALIPNLVAAQTAEEDQTTPATQEWRGGPRMGPHGFGGFGGGVDVTAELTGTTTDDVITALRDGASLASHAAEHGVAREELTSAIEAAIQQRLDERVAAGEITQERADELLAEIDQKVEDLVDRDGFAPRGGGGCNQEEGEETSTSSI